MQIMVSFPSFIMSVELLIITSPVILKGIPIRMTIHMVTTHILTHILHLEDTVTVGIVNQAHIEDDDTVQMKVIWTSCAAL